jgi:hypothetical protein
MSFDPIDWIAGVKLTPGRAAVIGLAIVILIVLAMFAGHGPPPPEKFVAGAPSTLQGLDSSLIAMLGPLDGPFIFVAAAAPNMLVLNAADGSSVTVILAGLRNEPYPAPPEAAQTDGVTNGNEPIDAQVAEQRRREIGSFQTKALADLLAGKQLYLQRLIDDPPPLVYLYEARPSPGGKPPAGQATLVQSLALRRGAALMEVGGAPHPFYDTMLDNMTAAIVEARRSQARAEDSANLWKRFAPPLPPQITDEALTAMGKRM